MMADEAILENHAAAREQEKFAEAHRAMDAQGVSNSVYGQAARESVLRARFDGPMKLEPGPIVVHRERTFTRAEVLAVLRAEQARHTPVFSANDQTGADKGRQRTLNDLLAIFGRME